VALIAASSLPNSPIFWISISAPAPKILYVAGVVAGERRPIYLHPIEIEVGGRDGPAFEALAGFMPDFSKSSHGLLGRTGFFDQFSFVKFKDLDNVIEIGKWHRQ
jgi:hypothetical protein